jgi:hypothetical protein
VFEIMKTMLPISLAPLPPDSGLKLHKRNTNMYEEQGTRAVSNVPKLSISNKGNVVRITCTLNTFITEEKQ